MSHWDLKALLLRAAELASESRYMILAHDLRDAAASVGPGFVRAKECPDCGHMRCNEACNCNCDAAHAEAEAAAYRVTIDRLLADRKAAVAAEREACAKICDDMAALYKDPSSTAQGDYRAAAVVLADQIRARGDA